LGDRITSFFLVLVLIAGIAGIIIQTPLSEGGGVAPVTSFQEFVQEPGKFFHVGSGEGSPLVSETAFKKKPDTDPPKFFHAGSGETIFDKSQFLPKPGEPGKFVHANTGATYSETKFKLKPDSDPPKYFHAGSSGTTFDKTEFEQKPGTDPPKYLHAGSGGTHSETKLKYKPDSDPKKYFHAGTPGTFDKSEFVEKLDDPGKFNHAGSVGIFGETAFKKKPDTDPPKYFHAGSAGTFDKTEFVEKPDDPGKFKHANTAGTHDESKFKKIPNSEPKKFFHAGSGDKQFDKPELGATSSVSWVPNTIEFNIDQGGNFGVAVILHVDDFDSSHLGEDVEISLADCIGLTLSTDPLLPQITGPDTPITFTAEAATDAPLGTQNCEMHGNAPFATNTAVQSWTFDVGEATRLPPMLFLDPPEHTLEITIGGDNFIEDKTLSIDNFISGDLGKALTVNSTCDGVPGIVIDLVGNPVVTGPATDFEVIFTALEGAEVNLLDCHIRVGVDSIAADPGEQVAAVNVVMPPTLVLGPATASFDLVRGGDAFIEDKTLSIEPFNDFFLANALTVNSTCDEVPGIVIELVGNPVVTGPTTNFEVRFIALEGAEVNLLDCHIRVGVDGIAGESGEQVAAVNVIPMPPILFLDPPVNTLEITIGGEAVIEDKTLFIEFFEDGLLDKSLTIESTCNLL